MLLQFEWKKRQKSEDDDKMPVEHNTIKINQNERKRMMFHAIGNCIFIILMTSYGFASHTHVQYDYYDNDGYEARAMHSITIIARLHIRRMIFEQQQSKHL